MKIIIAENSGFCFGVSKAIETTKKILSENTTKTYSLGPLIHNNHVIEQLKQEGLDIIENIQEADNSKVIIRSHGVPLHVYDTAKEKNIELVDCTCPFVRKIQNKVKKFNALGYQIVIIGNAKHPEVVGINGWCDNSAIIINNEEDIEVMLNYDKICIVAQTTFYEGNFNRLAELVSLKGNEVKIFNTICNATQLRQKSCEEISKISDAMVVIGGYHSSNTQKLVEISRKFCNNTFHIETADQLPISELKKFNTVGLTAGASTPSWIIKEVYDKMSNLGDMNELMKAIEDTMVKVHRGETVKGKVISVRNDEVMVNIGYKSDGIIKRDELTNDPDITPSDILSAGDEIEVLILRLDDGDGNVILSKKRVDTVKSWDEIEEIFNNKSIVNAKVIEIVNGGVIALVKGLRGFIPISQIANRFVNDLQVYMGKSFDVRVIDFDRNKKRIVLSRKSVELEEAESKKNKLWKNIEKGQIIEGEVKRITDFGVFVDIGGVDGLIHISDLSWSHVKHPKEVVKEGDIVKVLILDADKQKNRISLGLKQASPHPWENIDEKYNIEDIVDGKVVRLVDFGAFVMLEQGIEGLVHISQISDKHIAKPSEELRVGENVRVKILDINKEEKKISLSIKEAVEKEVNETIEYNTEEEITIGDILKENK
ncbi:bifunctional 4-hydroxy-3-methylbut-2-enyl diphosphate reductase/30S ribosomal protein S1 [Proteiniborus sp. MB09-C3]|uniref:bifunctional 4-hydroxy-3-methylbut-2-enyl diphosphate reductase/30S ribosomal protein S1 n=1 Tax=Proteiniborus sp. MB09-C3 TaxID=3050072 RepID=UPI002554B0A6|nr:bifunctional 4-hydroxy-3-methylbut-2-enyl diphosphate reductase/30S ribosomal protein S1 [Proteiniborus sp. MB09-C3]WIV10949.1 bifunctional 4-hydroxy-3-methylbut-2-enyl diphosphate reductase/30S ribosomal protein S1 [Proteiniborus sp. MB09-C3]